MLVHLAASAIVGMPLREDLEWLGSFSLSTALVAVVVNFLALRSEWRGVRLAVVLAGLLFAIEFVNILEGVTLLDSLGVPWGRVLARAFVTSVLIAPMLFMIFRTATVRVFAVWVAWPLSVPSWAGHVALGAVCYIGLYVLAGMIVFPYVDAFYVQRNPLPPFSTVLALQGVRGSMYVGLCVLMLRMMRLPRAQAALALAWAFTSVNALAPLLPPNEWLPDAIRWAHLYECALSNAVFGALIGLMWGRPAPASLPAVI